MSIIPHGLTASLITRLIETAIQKRISRKWVRIIVVASIAIPLAFFSHFILDAFPHWDPFFKWEYIGIPKYLLRKLGPDLVLLLFLLAGRGLRFWQFRCLFQSQLTWISAAISMIPDLIVVYYAKTPWFQSFIHFHHWMHSSIHPGRYWGMVWPLIFTFVLAITLTYLAKQSNFWSIVSKYLEAEQISET